MRWSGTERLGHRCVACPEAPDQYRCNVFQRREDGTSIEAYLEKEGCALRQPLRMLHSVRWDFEATGVTCPFEDELGAFLEGHPNSTMLTSASSF